MSIFTRRHYVWLASAMRDAKRDSYENPGSITENFVRSIANALEHESFAFHREEFLHNSLCDPTDHVWSDDCPFKGK